MRLINLGFFILILTLFSGCAVIGGIFKLGVWSGVIIVVAVIVIIAFIISQVGKKQ